MITFLLGAAIGIALWEALAPSSWRMWVSLKVDALWAWITG